MIEDFAATKTCINALQRFASAGLSVEAHAGYFDDGTDNGRIEWGDGTIDLGTNTGAKPNACNWIK